MKIILDAFHWRLLLIHILLTRLEAFVIEDFYFAVVFPVVAYLLSCCVSSVA